MNTHLVKAIRDMDLALLDGAAAGPLEHLAKSLPETGGAMFECHLSSSQKRVDFAVRVGAGEEAAKLLAGEAPWANVREFYRHGIRRWAKAEPEVFSWLEFDKPTNGVAEANEPGLFVRQRELNLGKRGDRSTLLHAVMDPVLESLGLARSYHAQFSTADKWLNKLPMGVSVHQIGLMPNRGHTLKIYLRMASQAQVEECVATLGLAKSGEGAVLAQLPRIKQLTDYFMVGVDIEPSGLSQQWGLECHVSRDVGQAKAWESFLAHCLAQAWCRPHQAKALTTWEQSRSKTVSRQISHLKLTSRGSTFVEAKAYLYVGATKEAKPSKTRTARRK